MNASRKPTSIEANKQSSLEERLRRIMLESGFRSIRGMAEGCGLAPATLSKRIQKERETGHAKVDGHTIQRIAQKTGFAAQWILTGEGSPYLDQGSAHEAKPKGEGRDRVDWGREVVEALVRQGIAPNRARHAVGALLLQRDAEFASVIQLYQASLEKLGFAHAPLEVVAQAKEASKERTSRASKKRSPASAKQNPTQSRGSASSGRSSKQRRNRQG